MSNTKKTKILIAASEFEPFTSIGHLGRVIPNLSYALNELSKKDASSSASAIDIDVRVVLPKYNTITDEYLNDEKMACEFEAVLGRRKYLCAVYMTQFRGVTVYLIRCGDYFENRTVYSTVVEDIERYSCFCNAVLSMFSHVGFEPDVIQCHDWQMSYIPTLYKMRRGARPHDPDLKTLFVIHSMQYQGVCSRYDMFDLLDLTNEFFTPSTLEFYGQANSLKGGLLFSDRLATVSPNFSKEIQHAYYGENLEGIIRSRSNEIDGIICGIDPAIYNPETDESIYSKYDVSTVHINKPKNKLRLQRIFGFEQNQDIPLIIIIADELDYDKGIDLIKHVFDEIMTYGIQIIFASKGISEYHDYFISKSFEYRDRVAYAKYAGGAVWEGTARAPANERADQDDRDAQIDGEADDIGVSGSILSETMLICGSDILLRPSRVEPCGEKHLIALKYGTLPIVRETGGLKDAVISYEGATGEGNGFSFLNFNAHDMLYTLNRAIRLYREDRLVWNRIIRTAMHVNITWEAAAEQYRDLYGKLVEAR